MPKILGVAVFVSETERVENYPDLKKLVHVIQHGLQKFIVTALFNNTRTLTFKAQPTNVFFATVNQMFDGSFQLPAIAERAVIKSLGTV